MRYRKKPVIVEAVQWFPGVKHPGVFQAEADSSDHDGCWSPDGILGAHVHTIHKNQPGVELEPGDWILPEPDGVSYYPVKPDIFATDYEPMDQETQS